jgi:hypothetical protein
MATRGVRGESRGARGEFHGGYHVCATGARGRHGVHSYEMGMFMEGKGVQALESCTRVPVRGNVGLFCRASADAVPRATLQ